MCIYFINQKSTEKIIKYIAMKKKIIIADVLLFKSSFLFPQWGEYDLIASINEPMIPIMAIPGLDEEMIYFYFLKFQL